MISVMVDWLALLIVVAIVYVLVRPRSQAAVALEGYTRAVVALVQTATGLAA